MASTVRASDGTFDLRWGSCDGPIDWCPTTGGPNALFASVVGIDQPHKGYQLTVIFGDIASGAAPDAWRFDSGGCQGRVRLRIDHLPPADVAEACPTFQGSAVSSQGTIVGFVPDTFAPEYARTGLFAHLVNAYHEGQPAADPAKRYYLARFLFDHTRSVVGATVPGVGCGGFEAPLEFQTLSASYLDGDGRERPFGLTGSRTVTTQGAGSCVPRPAKNPTWGAIKGQYRR